MLDYVAEAKNTLNGVKLDAKTIHSTMDLWMDINEVLKLAYIDRDEDLVAEIFLFANWCFANYEQLPASEADDMLTSVVVNLYGTIPTIQKAWPDIPKYISEETFVEMRDVFIREITSEQYDLILVEYKKAGEQYQPSL
jgi:hypothetical protein